MASWRSASTVPFATQSLFKVYTLVTQEMLSEVIFNNWNPDCRHHKCSGQQSVFLLGIEAAAFIGNSVSTFQVCFFREEPKISRGAFTTMEVAFGCRKTEQLKPKQRLAPRTLRSRIKWIFCIHPGNGDVESPRFKAAKVAIKVPSARLPWCQLV